MARFGKKKIIIAGVAGALVAAGSGIALAYWTSQGAGTGGATTGTTQDIAINQTSTVSGLYPGGPAAPLSGDFTNPNSGKIYVAQVTVSIPAGWSAQADASKPACTGGDFTLVQPAPTNAEIDPGTHVGSWGGGSIALNDSGTNQDNCKNVTVPLDYASS